MDTVKNGKEDVRLINTVTADYFPSVPLYKDISLGSVVLPLNPATTSSTFSFNLDQNEARTFTVNYQIDPKTIFEQCGEQLMFSKLTTENNSFPISRVTVDSIHDPPYTNIVSYRCPVTNTIRVLFKQSKGSSKVTDTLNLVSLTDNFSGTEIYSNAQVTNVVLPLNPNATTTQYTFNSEGGTNTLQLKYTTTPTTFHAVCGPQVVFSDIEVLNSDFVTVSPIVVTDPKAKYPTVNNIEILR
jgi:hypothetical protein